MVLQKYLFASLKTFQRYPRTSDMRVSAGVFVWCQQRNSQARRSHTALAVQAVLFFSLYHPLEHGNLSEEISFCLSRAAKHFRACIHIRNDARLRSDLRALTDPKMSGHSRLPPDANEILKHG
jgi:hypothetical protein